MNVFQTLTQNKSYQLRASASCWVQIRKLVRLKNGSTPFQKAISAPVFLIK